MAITVNEGGTLYELDEVWSNEGGTLYEQDSVWSNEGGTLYEIHSAASFPDAEHLLSWDATGKTNFTQGYMVYQNTHTAVIRSAATSSTTARNATSTFSIKGNVKLVMSFVMSLSEAGSGGWRLSKDGELVSSGTYTENKTVTNTLFLSTGTYTLFFGAGSGSSSGSHDGAANVSLKFSKA